MQHKNTKVVCTIGPVTETHQKLVELAEAGMNVARLNFSHGTHEWHAERIKHIKNINAKTNHNIAIMLDTKGPEVRVGDLPEPVNVKTGDSLTFTVAESEADGKAVVFVKYAGLAEDAEVGDEILIEGGLISFEVVKVTETKLFTRCINGGELTSRRHLNIRGKSARLDSITEKDWEDIAFGIEHGVDFIALSLVNDRESVDRLREKLNEAKAPIEIVSKIESVGAIENLEEIVDASDGLMVARGDLGFEFPLEDVPMLQDRIIMLAREAAKPVIVATQMIESMMENPVPTRAEVSDIANAVKAEADAIMLSGETAGGKYPIRAVQTMSRVATRTETSMGTDLDIFDYLNINYEINPKSELIKSAAIISHNLDGESIVLFTRSGGMARLMAQFRPDAKIYAFTNTSHVRRRLNLYWGVKSFRIDFSQDPEKTIEKAMEVLAEQNLLEDGDTAVVVTDIIVGDKSVNSLQIREFKK